RPCAWWLDGIVGLVIAGWEVIEGRLPGPGRAARVPVSPERSADLLGSGHLADPALPPSSIGAESMRVAAVSRVASVGQDSIGSVSLTWGFGLERAKGIEPSCPAWKVGNPDRP